jgi:hypothetical protein
MNAPPTVQMLPTIWPAPLNAVADAAGAPLEMMAGLVGAATRGVEVMRWEEARTEEDFTGVEVTRVDEVMVGVLVEVGVWVGVGVDVGVVRMVTGIQFRSSGPRVPDGVTVPAEAWHEA